LKEKVSIKDLGGKRSGKIHLPTSKSISNRLLILQALSGMKIEIQDLSMANDTKVLKNILCNVNELNNKEIDVEDAGTAFRFLTAFLSISSGEWILNGTARMKERPVKPLVDALIQLGCDIEYLEQIGFPPLKIIGRKINVEKITLHQGMSSQFLTALLLVAPSLENGLCIHLKGEPVSQPYLRMTLQILEQVGVKVTLSEDSVFVSSFNFKNQNFVVEKDWSSASYWYAMTAFSQNGEYKLPGLKKSELQGDSILPDIFKSLGVKTSFTKEGAILSKIRKKTNNISLNLQAYPDLAQTIAVVCAGLGIRASLRGLQTLKIKETDRLNALKTELRKMNVNVRTPDEQSLIIEPSELKVVGAVDTYNDHRMAMSFATLVQLNGEIEICNPSVVAKSYPGFWDDLGQNNFEVVINR